MGSVLTGKLLDAVDRGTARYTTSPASVLTPRLVTFARTSVFWLIFVLAVVLSLRVLGVGGVSAIVNSAVDFLPRLLIAFSILVAGYLIGLVARHVVGEVVDGLDRSSVVPRLLQATIVAVAVVMGLQQIGVDISFITRLILILVAAVSAGLMLAFALGARRHVANLLAGRDLGRLSVGQRLRIDSIEGEIVDVRSTAIDVATDDGIATVPAIRIAEAGYVIVDAEDEDD